MNKGTLLAVDDNPDNLMLLAGILERAGYDVRAVNSARRALTVIEREVPELVLLDVEMPGMNGYQLCSVFKTQPQMEQVPVLFLSAHNDVPDKVRGFQAGGVDYISKPFHEEEVLARVEVQLKVHRLQREVEERNRELLATNQRLQRANERTMEAFGAVSSLVPGHLLEESYRVDSMIGEGGFGAVYRGEDLRLRRPVAIKILRPTGGGDRSLRRFQREGIAACRVKHPNAVEVLKAGSSRGVAYLVMELLEGRPLAARMRDGALPVADAVRIAADVADALTAAHAAGVIHRDITPGNIFLHRGEQGEVVKVLDFGIARIVDEDTDPEARAAAVTATMELIGTPEYMPPERLLGGTYDASSDIYSLGVVLFRMLTAQPRFEKQTRYTMEEAIRLHLEDTPRSLASFPAVPADLAEFADTMLHREPAERPTSREVSERLKAMR